MNITAWLRRARHPRRAAGPQYARSLRELRAKTQAARQADAETDALLDRAGGKDPR